MSNAFRVLGHVLSYPSFTSYGAERLLHTNSLGDQIRQRRKEGRLGGQNLTERGVRLAKSIRGKESYFDTPETVPLNESLDADPSEKVKLPLDVVDRFHGLVIPEKPKPPSSDECCMSGCAICVYDLHQEAVNSYQTSMKAVKASLLQMHVPRAQWPIELQGLDSQVFLQNPSLSAFEALEEALRRKRVNNG